MNFNQSIENRKSDKKSNEYREFGNLCYGRKQFMNALELYNQSIAYACSKREISLSYSNRSAVYYEIERYDECLDNIKKARENGYPRDKISKLNDREKKCMIKKAECSETVNLWDYLKLSYPANEKVPWVADCVEVRWTKKYGRGIYATKDLKAGDIVCIEEPIIILQAESCYRHCQNCFKTNMMNLIPCSRTVSMFCSTECIHDFNSKTAGMEFSLLFDSKILSEVAAPFGGYKKFDEFMKKTDLSKLNKTIFDFDFSDSKDPEYKKNLMTCFLSLSTTNDHMHKKSRHILKYVSKKTADHLYGISTLNDFGAIYFNGINRYFIGGNQICAFGGLLNHSCNFNTDFINAGNKNIVFIRKPIKAGEQLFVTYTEINGSAATHERCMNIMMERFKFSCECEICVNKSYRQSPDNPLPRVFLDRKNPEKALQILREGWRLINNNELKSFEELCNILNRNWTILIALTYYCTFPC